MEKAGWRIKRGKDAPAGAIATGSGLELVAGSAAQHGIEAPSGQHGQALEATLVTPLPVVAAWAEIQGATASSKLKMMAVTDFIALIIRWFGETAKRFLFDASHRLVLMPPAGEFRFVAP